MKRKYIWLIIMLVIFLSSLTGLRLIWLEWFDSATRIEFQDGELDLRERDLTDDEIFLLDGGWEFYPYAFIMEQEDTGESTSKHESIEVPNGWNDKLGSSFGYGSYRLQIKVDPNLPTNYSLYIPSIRSSSEVYVNGRLLGSSGEVARSGENYTARNLPYNLFITPDNQGLIDIVIQAANYKDIRNSGIIRSMKFGTDHAITRESQISSNLQMVTIIFFLINSIYTLIIYFLGNRDKRLLFFSLLSISIIIITLLSTGDKLFHQLFYISYDFDFRLANAVALIACFALMQCTNHGDLPYWRKIFPYFQIIIWAMALITMFLSIPQVISSFPIYYLLIGITVTMTLIAIIRNIRQDVQTNLLLVLSFAAVLHHFAWTLGLRELNLYYIYYPFDLIIAALCYVMLWFRKYFQTYRETKQLAASLQRMNEQKDQFLANTSHEFRNPLNSIILLSKSVLEREYVSLQTRSRKELNTVLKVGKRMSLLLTDLLEARKLEHGQPRLNKQVIALAPVVTGVIDMVRFSVEMKQLKMENRIPSDFPAVYADENRVVQIFYNIIENAIKYTNQGTITITASINREAAEIAITDTGIGISPEMQKRIFNPYEQDHSNKTILEGGFGLGLSITRQLVELHGGTIRVDSKQGEGTRISFTLKLAHAEEAIRLPQGQFFNMVDEEEKGRSEATIPYDIERPAILVVDDDPANLLAMEAVLPVEKYHMVLVSSASKALEEIQNRQWDLVISDIMMPDISGYELTKSIRERYSLTELPVLLLTGNSTTIQTSFIAGANDYVTKPVESVELQARVDSLITLKKVAEQQLQLETSWLQAQIQPHFLFNTLNSIIALSEWDLKKMRQVLNTFSEFLRSKFQFHQMDSLIPIEEELHIVRSYLYIEQVRFGDLLEVKWEVADSQDIKVPFLSIQPLVENAIRHGIRKKQGKGTITVKLQANHRRSEATVMIEDNGIGMNQERIQAVLKKPVNSESGVGLLNVEQRLKQFYGKGLTIESTPDQGTKVSFTVTLHHD
ncbi:ATP-binding protein [Gracilibacillus alcaliphilus]|uniref:ATP-binding protein n=1 Tax=Gracilibacillus alcaliphilus TaxID=1401441 RepID=UPI0019588BD1|nr:ATP-binding protein [Gracilibacillus alcaliphilus]MBM7676315.1 sensor histidine kinase YesM [Gracilibacillus alcaliphilus]